MVPVHSDFIVIAIGLWLLNCQTNCLLVYDRHAQQGQPVGSTIAGNPENRISEKSVSLNIP